MKQYCQSDLTAKIIILNKAKSIKHDGGNSLKSKLCLMNQKVA